MSEAEYSSLEATSAFSAQVAIEIWTKQYILNIFHTYHNPNEYFPTLYLS